MDYFIDYEYSLTIKMENDDVYYLLDGMNTYYFIKGKKPRYNIFSGLGERGVLKDDSSIFKHQEKCIEDLFKTGKVYDLFKKPVNQEIVSFNLHMRKNLKHYRIIPKDNHRLKEEMKRKYNAEKDS